MLTQLSSVARTDASLDAWRPRFQRWRRSLLAEVTRPIYALYGRRLLEQVMQRPPPRHVGIILDGNRRFGRLSGLIDPVQVYAQGAQKLDDLLNWCGELSIPAVTLWVCSTDNLERQPHEVAGILGALEVKLRSLVDDPRIHSRRVRVQAIGRLDVLPESTLAAIRAAEEATAGYDAMLLSIAVAYGGREEIADAVREMLAEAMRGRRIVAGDHGRCVSRADRPASLPCGCAGARPDHQDKRRVAVVGLSALAECLQRVLFLGCAMAGVQEDRLPARGARVSAAQAPLRPLTAQVPAEPRQVAAHEGTQRALQQT